MRKLFKSTMISGKCYLYPVPVIKDHKYLIEVDSRISLFLRYCFEHEFLVSPDKRPDYLLYLKKHSDDQTNIYSISLDKLIFQFLPNRDSDLEKAEVLESLISGKIRDIFNLKPNAIFELKKRFEKQKQCSTCIELGILDPRVQKFIDRASVVDSIP